MSRQQEQTRTGANDWAFEVSDTEKRIVLLAENELEEGLFISHEQVMDEINHRLTIGSHSNPNSYPSD